jgi:soluble lytic murein transglycosylase-like protein
MAENGAAHPLVETILAARDTEGPIARLEYSDTVVALASAQPAKPGTKLGYVKALPQELAAKAKALSAHISEKFKVDPAHANNVVTSAMQTASKTGLPPTLVLAVIAVESSFKASARNGNARGLMQIIPFWHKEKVQAVGGPEELMKVDKNIATGSSILKEYIDRHGSVFQGLYRYNASSKAKEYSEKVLKQKNGFEAVMAEEK